MLHRSRMLRLNKIMPPIGDHGAIRMGDSLRFSWRRWGAALAFLCVWGMAAASAPKLADLKRQLEQPEQSIDFAEAKLTVDRLIDPSIDSTSVLRELDQLTQAAKARMPAGLGQRARMNVLLETLYKPGLWNGNRPFSYDLNDPFGKERRSKLLSTYLRTRKGNCVSMPILVAIIAQRLGLVVTLATAPEHVLVKFVADDGVWWNVEATAGGNKYDSSYERELEITPLAIQNQIYLRPLTPREAVGVMASTLMEELSAKKRADDLMSVADMVLAVNPKDTVAIIHKANAYYLQLEQRYQSKYPRPADIPVTLQEDFKMRQRENLTWFDKAEALGWQPPTAQNTGNYLQSVEREKTQRGKQ